MNRILLRCELEMLNASKRLRYEQNSDEIRASKRRRHEQNSDEIRASKRYISRIWQEMNLWSRKYNIFKNTLKVIIKNGTEFICATSLVVTYKIKIKK